MPRLGMDSEKGEHGLPAKPRRTFLNILRFKIIVAAPVLDEIAA